MYKLSPRIYHQFTRFQLKYSITKKMLFRLFMKTNSTDKLSGRIHIFSKILSKE